MSMKVGIFIAALAWSTSASAFDPNGSFIGIYNQNCAQGATGTMQHFVADKNGNIKMVFDAYLIPGVSKFNSAIIKFAGTYNKSTRTATFTKALTIGSPTWEYSLPYVVTFSPDFKKATWPASSCSTSFTLRRIGATGDLKPYAPVKAAGNVKPFTGTPSAP